MSSGTPSDALKNTGSMGGNHPLHASQPLSARSLGQLRQHERRRNRSNTPAPVPPVQCSVIPPPIPPPRSASHMQERSSCPPRPNSNQPARSLIQPQAVPSAQPNAGNQPLSRQRRLLNISCLPDVPSNHDLPHLPMLLTNGTIHRCRHLLPDMLFVVHSPLHLLRWTHLPDVPYVHGNKQTHCQLCNPIYHQHGAYTVSPMDAITLVPWLLSAPAVRHFTGMVNV
ncbi:hypothetical protein PAXINDRAFT_7777 [Paxillus involutus ATCC 200175]|nr:hypothetical protein PAXINDRAFT_7777 [Paxillus involutus ATCC 200175]